MIWKNPVGLTSWLFSARKRFFSSPLLNEFRDVILSSRRPSAECRREKRRCIAAVARGLLFRVGAVRSGGDNEVGQHRKVTVFDIRTNRRKGNNMRGIRGLLFVALFFGVAASQTGDSARYDLVVFDALQKAYRSSGLLSGDSWQAPGVGTYVPSDIKDLHPTSFSARFKDEPAAVANLSPQERGLCAFLTADGGLYVVKMYISIPVGWGFPPGVSYYPKNKIEIPGVSISGNAIVSVVKYQSGNNSIDTAMVACVSTDNCMVFIRVLTNNYTSDPVVVDTVIVNRYEIPPGRYSITSFIDSAAFLPSLCVSLQSSIQIEEYRFPLAFRCLPGPCKDTLLYTAASFNPSLGTVMCRNRDVVGTSMGSLWRLNKGNFTRLDSIGPYPIRVIEEDALAGDSGMFAKKTSGGWEYLRLGTGNYRYVHLVDLNDGQYAEMLDEQLRLFRFLIPSTGMKDPGTASDVTSFNRNPVTFRWESRHLIIDLSESAPPIARVNLFDVLGKQVASLAVDGKNHLVVGQAQAWRTAVVCLTRTNGEKIYKRLIAPLK
jgi:hypothetical protein